ncbi:uncharacterized protein [Ptychodera flava]|uniref:uncharacterized protein isoform X2 n=1 Tax=Ptychodera flava TaxID=63121 RepID=UPI00396A4EBC
MRGQTSSIKTETTKPDELMTKIDEIGNKRRESENIGVAEVVEWTDKADQNNADKKHEVTSQSTGLRQQLMALQRNSHGYWQDLPLPNADLSDKTSDAHQVDEPKFVIGEKRLEWIPFSKACTKCLTRKRPSWDPWENWSTTMEQGNEDEQGNRQNRVQTLSGNKVIGRFSKSGQSSVNEKINNLVDTPGKLVTLQKKHFVKQESEYSKIGDVPLHEDKPSEKFDETADVIILDEEEEIDIKTPTTSNVHDKDRTVQGLIKSEANNKKPLFKQRKSTHKKNMKGLMSGKPGPMSKFMVGGITSRSMKDSAASQERNVKSNSSNETRLQNCPLCTVQFASEMSQLDIDAHIAACLSSTNVDVLW